MQVNIVKIEPMQKIHLKIEYDADCMFNIVQRILHLACLQSHMTEGNLSLGNIPVDKVIEQKILRVIVRFGF